eukprot:CAMPEP_0202362586 /NCGR_PEP_ID=MMETSP1126-20121109/14713_1 /ASSEMBLY_ACC=CAM_ASM_000457 /TAXON_ID=3047 /ORGANISM="Dunaliella tertiolecta, Strain CCMP1320" /LENGTH=87 /DNA_ID=CAMNT_0048956815 /DNA_START=242 /DNA_END=502 /DNA_ORIENTATION=-
MALRKSVHAGDSWGGKRSCWPEEIENSTLESQLLLLEPYPGHHACAEETPCVAIPTPPWLKGWRPVRASTAMTPSAQTSFLWWMLGW